jgi:hypothetical protein
MEWKKNAIDVRWIDVNGCAGRMKRLCDGLKDHDFVDMDGWGSDGQLIVTSGVDWHIDPGFGPITALCILENGGLPVREWGGGSVVPNPGDVVLLDVHKRHKAGFVGEGKYLVAIAMDFPLGTSMEEACNRLREEILLGYSG